MSAIIHPINTSYFLAAYQGDSKQIQFYYHTLTREEALEHLRRSCERIRKAAGEDQKAEYDKLFWVGEASPEATPRQSASGGYRSYCSIENIGTTVNPVSADNTYTCGSWRFVIRPL